jgi:hypothetical protein
MLGTQNTYKTRNNRGNTGFSRHIPNTGHSYGSIEDTTTVLKMTKKDNIWTVYKIITYKKLQTKTSN